jgi:hypothetical protein
VGLRRGAAALALSALLGVALSACGGSSGSSGRVSAISYAGALCKAVGPFEQEIYARQNALAVTGVSSPTAGKKVLEQFMSALQSDSAKAKRQLQAAGVPDINGGQSLATALVPLFGRIDTTLQTAAAEARALPTGSATAFRAGAVKLAATVKTSVGDLGTGLGHVSRGSLEAAARKAPACRSFT